MRRKVRIAGIWINRDKITRRHADILFRASTRPLAKIASSQTLPRYQIGLANVEPQSIGTHSPAKAEPFRLAAIAERARAGLYARNEGVEFLSYSLFRVRVPIPATVPRGRIHGRSLSVSRRQRW